MALCARLEAPHGVLKPYTHKPVFVISMLRRTLLMIPINSTLQSAVQPRYKSWFHTPGSLRVARSYL